MDRKDPSKISALMPLLVIGTTLNTLGIVFTGLGWARFVMMAAGLVLLLIFLVRVLQLHAAAHDAPTKRAR